MAPKTFALGSVAISAVMGLGSPSEAAQAPRLRLTSTDVANGKAIATEQVLNGFGCMGAKSLDRVG